MVKSMDRNRSESIEYIEFIIAAIDRKDLVGDEDNLRGIFRDMDKSGRGFITLNDMKQALPRLAEESEQSLQEIMGIFDSASFGRVTFPEFAQVMRI